MKNLIYKTIFLFSFLMILGACEEKELVELNPDANTVVSLSPSTLVLLEENAAANATTVSWTDPDFAFESRGKIEAKGKGEMEMWFVKRVNSE